MAAVPKPAPSSEIAIIGAGIIGLSIAWHLAERGVRGITVYDRVGIGAGATSIQPGGVRQQWSTEIACRIAREAYEFYMSFDDRLAVDSRPSLTSCGYVFVARGQNELDRLRTTVALQNRLGIPSRILTPQETGEIVPGLAPEAIAGASFCADDGYFDRPLAVVAGFAEACRRHGVRFVDGRIAGLGLDGAGLRMVLGDGTTAGAARVVLATGHDTPELTAPLGYDLPIRREPKYLFYSQPIRERLLEPLVTSHEDHFAAKHLADGSVLASDLTAAGEPKTGRAHWYSHIRRTITELVPILEYVTFPVLVEGFYDVTPDRQPILGALDDEQRLWTASGLNGRGLMMAPAIGRLLADALTDANRPRELQALGAERFAADRLLPESQVV